jgi:hypothetical protein
MMAALCPPGSEGASYAMFTTAQNSAILLAPSMSSMLLSIWDVSDKTLAARDLQGLFYLSVLTNVLQTCPILSLHWLLHYREDLLELASKPKGNRALGGGLFLLILVLSVGIAVVVGVLNIVDPGWAGESYKISHH